jgi:hypothetical protein
MPNQWIVRLGRQSHTVFPVFYTLEQFVCMFRHQKSGSLRVCLLTFVFAVSGNKRILEANIVILPTPTHRDLYTITPIVRTS